MYNLCRILPVFFLLLTAACQEKQRAESNGHENHAEGHSDSIKDQGANRPSVSMVELNQGKKWKANPETIEGIGNMLKLVEDGQRTKAAPSRLYEPLLVEFKTIFEKCTMKGDAHDQLHNYLIPLKGQLEGLNVSGADTTNLKTLENYLLLFPNYFE